MPSRLPCACALAAFALYACGGTVPDPYAGWYSGEDKVVRIRTSGSYQYEVDILPKAGDTATVRANLYEGKLTSEYGGGFTLTQETAVDYSMGVPPKTESLKRIDSAAFAQWLAATRPEFAPPDPADAVPEDTTDLAPPDSSHKPKSRFRP